MASWEFLTQTRVRSTRKEHLCIGCLEKIPKGSSANYWAGKYDGEFQSHYLCDPCQAYLEEADVEEFAQGDLGTFRREEGYC